MSKIYSFLFRKELQAVLVVNATGFGYDMMILRNAAGLLYPKIGGAHMRSGSACYRYRSFENRLRDTKKKETKIVIHKLKGKT